MKLGVSYNVFDGEELLEGSLKQIRDYVDYISVVCQTTSNFGNPCSVDLIDILKDLKHKKLIDDVFLYKPNLNLFAGANEVMKRNIGLEKSLAKNCTHHMSMDCDEYFLTEQFAELKQLLKKEEWDSSYCQMQTYYKSWEYSLDPPEDYYVSLITKINQDSSYVFGAPSPVLIDPTRRIFGLHKPLILKREQIQMHHGSYIRNNIKTKLENSSASVNFKRDLNELIKHFNEWKYPDKVLLGGLPSSLKSIKQIKPFF